MNGFELFKMPELKKKKKLHKYNGHSEETLFDNL